MKKISFVINTAKNELDHLKLLLESLELNLDRKDHEILIFIDSDNQGTLEVLKSLQPRFKDMKIITHKLNPCVGYSRNKNIMVDKAKYDIISYLQSDMVISPHYDTDIIECLEDDCILSATRVEPPLHESETTITKDFGLDPLYFDMDTWNTYSVDQKNQASLNYFFAPITFRKDTWKGLGGYDTLFRRSREDSDLVQRCLQAGIKLKQTFSAIVYHFTCVSSRGPNWYKDDESAKKRLELQKKADVIELRRFIRRWGTFNHGSEVLKKYDVDFFIKNSSRISPSLVWNLEPKVSKVWLDNKEVTTKMLSMYENEQSFANYLLDFSAEDWENNQKFYNIEDYSKIYEYSKNTPKEYNVLLTLDADNYTVKDSMLFNNLHKVLDNSEPGTYEFGSIKIDIRTKISKKLIKITNPKMDKNLLEIV